MQSLALEEQKEVEGRFGRRIGKPDFGMLGFLRWKRCSVLLLLPVTIKSPAMMVFARNVFAFAVTALAAVSFAHAQNTSDLKVNDVLERYYASNGGLENIQSIRSLRAEGTIRRSTGEEGVLLLLKKRPNLQLTTIEMADGRVIKRGSGSQGSWVALERPRMPAHVEPASDNIDARFDSLLVASDSEKATLNLLEPVREGRDLLYPIEAKHDNAKTTIIYLEARTLREVRRVEKWLADGVPQERVVELSQHTKVNNVWFAKRQVSRSDGEETIVEFDRISVNPGIFDDAFNAPPN